MKTLLPIVTYPKNIILHTACAVVTRQMMGEKKFKELIRSMIHTMYHDSGIGIAAPQVGHQIRLAIVGKDALRQSGAAHPFGHSRDLVMLNPSYIPLSTEMETQEEGCLSVLNRWGEVPRHKKIYVRLRTPDGTRRDFTATDFLARVLQHEIDHLNGVLFLDRAVRVGETEGQRRYPTV